MMAITNLDISYDELGEEFQKLALLVPTIPKDRYLTELEFIEFVIAYIRQLQQLLSYDRWNECMYNKLVSSTKNSLLSSSSSSPSSSHLFNQLILQSPRISIIRRSPLATINLDNTQLS